MDMFEYYGFFREEDSTDRLTVAETEIIEHLFDKYLPKEGRVIDTSAGFGTFTFRFAENGYKVTVCDPSYANYKWVPDLSIYDEYENVNTFISEGVFADEEVDNREDNCHDNTP